MPRRWCSDQPCNVLITPPATRCDPHQAAADQRAAASRARATAGRPSTSARGYGSIYRRRRDRIVRQALALADAGTPLTCWRCGAPLLRGQQLVADHADGNPAAADPRTARLEPVHAACNAGHRHPA